LFKLSIVQVINAAIVLAVPNNSVIEISRFTSALPSIPPSNVHEGVHFVTSPHRDVALKDAIGATLGCFGLAAFAVVIGL
jgi:hypothetical protein